MLTTIDSYEDLPSGDDFSSYKGALCVLAREADSTLQSPTTSKPSHSRKRAPQHKQDKPASARALFSKAQVARLEARFRDQSFLSREERLELAEHVGISERQVMIWFQNRRGRLKKRGPLDGAYNPAKLQEINVRRPYPFLCGVISNQHQYRHHTGNAKHLQHGVPFNVYPKEVRAHLETIVPHLPTTGRQHVVDLTCDRKKSSASDFNVTPPPNVTVFDMENRRAEIKKSRSPHRTDMPVGPYEHSPQNGLLTLNTAYRNPSLQPPCASPNHCSSENSYPATAVVNEHGVPVYTHLLTGKTYSKTNRILQSTPIDIQNDSNEQSDNQVLGSKQHSKGLSADLNPESNSCFNSQTVLTNQSQMGLHGAICRLNPLDAVSSTCAHSSQSHMAADTAGPYTAQARMGLHDSMTQMTSSQCAYSQQLLTSQMTSSECTYSQQLLIPHRLNQSAAYSYAHQSTSYAPYQNNFLAQSNTQVPYPMGFMSYLDGYSGY